MVVFKFFCFSLLICVGILALIVNVNRFYVKPNRHEIAVLKNSYGDIKISNKKDIINIQNRVFAFCKHEFVSDAEIKIENVIEKGLCYDRSLILQKILIYNNIPIRPIYLYYGGRTNSFLDLFFDFNLGSHSIFEFKFQNQYYVMPTSTKMKEFENIEEHLDSFNPNFPKGKAKYIRYLSNRNSRFIYPSWIPDIYYFN